MQFKIPDEVASSPKDDFLGVSKSELLMACAWAVQRAWKDAIEPRMSQIRAAQVSLDHFKKGFDFFTEADVEAERTIKEVISGAVDADLNFQGEEEADRGKNTTAAISIRVDPIDGTELFKFGTPNWSIMVGAYAKVNGHEKQFLSVTYFPEYFKEIIFRIDSIGVYKTNIETGVVEKIQNTLPRDDISDLLLLVHKNHDVARRGTIESMCAEFEKKGARIRSCSPAHTKQALETRGSRAFMIQGDWSHHDFILYSALVSLGYRIYSFTGDEIDVDDSGIAKSNFMLVPPGRAGETLRTYVSAAESTLR